MPVTITNPEELMALLKANLDEVPEVLALLGGDPDNIEIHTDQGELAGKLENLRPPQLLIYWDGIEPTQFPNTMKYLVGIALRVRYPAQLFQAILEGVSTYTGGDGLPMLCSTIHPRFLPMDMPTLERTNIQSAFGGRVFDTFILRTAFTAKGST
jgi:hypothetical protein